MTRKFKIKQGRYAWIRCEQISKFISQVIEVNSMPQIYVGDLMVKTPTGWQAFRDERMLVPSYRMPSACEEE